MVNNNYCYYCYYCCCRRNWPRLTFLIDFRLADFQMVRISVFPLFRISHNNKILIVTNYFFTLAKGSFNKTAISLETHEACFAQESLLAG